MGFACEALAAAPCGATLRALDLRGLSQALWERAGREKRSLPEASVRVSDSLHQDTTSQGRRFNLIFQGPQSFFGHMTSYLVIYRAGVWVKLFAPRTRLLIEASPRNRKPSTRFGVDRRHTSLAWMSPCVSFRTASCLLVTHDRQHRTETASP